MDRFLDDACSANTSVNTSVSEFQAYRKGLLDQTIRESEAGWHS